MINSKYLILIIIIGLSILYYSYNCKKNKYKKILGGGVNVLNITTPFSKSNYSTTSAILNKNFNYNNFDLNFRLGRTQKFITEMSGGIITLGSNTNNYHNFIIHLKEQEFIVSLLGYNTHLSYNLKKLKNAVIIDFSLIYKYPYLNIYVIGYDKNETKINEGYINYLGELEKVKNNNYRLYLHPFVNGFGFFGTTSFIQDGNNLSEATGILNNSECFINNININHEPREQYDIYKNTSINNEKILINNLDSNILLENINIIKIKLVDDNLNKSGILFRFFYNNKSINLIKEQNELFLRIVNEENKEFELIKFYLKKTINEIYIELIPFFKKHIFCIYIDNTFYKHILNISNSSINNTEITFNEIMINESYNGYKYVKEISDINNLVTEFSVLGEFLKNDNSVCKDLNSITDDTLENDLCEIFDIKLLNKPDNVIRINCSTLEFSYNKNIKLEYLKLLNKNTINYKLYVYDVFINKYKLINNLQINKHNIDEFTNVYLNIDDNTIGHKYKLVLYSDIYTLTPLKIKNSEGNFENNFENIKDSDTNDILWYFHKIKKINNNQFITYIYDYNKYNTTSSKSNTLYQSQSELENINPSNEYVIENLEDDNFIIKIKDSNNVDAYILYYDNSSNLNNIRLKSLPLLSGDSKNNYTFIKTDYIKSDLDGQYSESSICKLKKINTLDTEIEQLEIKDEIDNLIELYGIEDPYPKLYIYNNDISKSLKPCSYIYSTHNSIIENMEAEITYISNKQDLLENNVRVNKNSPLIYWGIEDINSNINVIMFSHNLLKFPALVPSCPITGTNDTNNPVVLYYTSDLERDKSSEYSYYGPSTRPLDAVYPSEFIMKLSYNKNNNSYNFEFTKGLNSTKNCSGISGNKITSSDIVDDANEPVKYKLGQFDSLKDTEIYLEKVNGVYDYEFYIYTIINNKRYYLDDSFKIGNNSVIKEATINPDYSKFTSWHIVPTKMVKQEYNKIMNEKNKISQLKSIKVLSSRYNVFDFDKSDIIFDKAEYNDLYLYNATKSSPDLDIYYKTDVKIGSRIDPIYELINVGTSSNTIKTITFDYTPYKVEIVGQKHSNGELIYPDDRFEYTINNKSVSIKRNGGWGQQLTMHVYKQFGSSDANGEILALDYIRVLHTKHSKDENGTTGKYCSFYKKDIERLLGTYSYTTRYIYNKSSDRYMRLAIYKNSDLPDSMAKDENGVETEQSLKEFLFDKDNQAYARIIDDEDNDIKFKKNDLLFYNINVTASIKNGIGKTKLTTYINKIGNTNLTFFENNINTMFKLEGDISRENIRKNMYKNINNYTPVENDILIYKSKNSKIEDLKRFVNTSKADINKYALQFKQGVDESVRGNQFGNVGTTWKGKNLIYNYCSNNISFYNNKKYAYNYENPDEKYYMLDKVTKNNYKNKKRVNLVELSKEQRAAKLLIDKLTSGVNIVGYQNNNNLNTIQPNNIFQIFTGSNSHFKLEWKNNSNSKNFKSGLLINLKIPTKDKFNISLTEDIFEKYNIKKEIKTLVKDLIIQFKSKLNKLDFRFIHKLDNFKDKDKEFWDGKQETTLDFDNSLKKCGIVFDYSGLDTDKCNHTFSYYEIHWNTFISKIFTEFIDTKLESLINLYMENVIPIYNNSNIHDYNWKIEFDGSYNPNTTEFHLKSLNMNKYLINAIVDDNNILKWSNTKKNGSGWKFKENNNTTSVNYSSTKSDKYRKAVEQEIKNRFYRLFYGNIGEFLNKKYEELRKGIENKQKCFNEYLVKRRVEKINNLNNKGCYIFSPNIGSKGKFLKYNKDGFSWTPNKSDTNTLFFISKTQNDIINDTNIKINDNTKKYTLKYSNKKLVWTKTDDSFKIKLNGNPLQLEIDRLNSNNTKSLNQINIEKQYVLIKNNNITLKVGQLLKTIQANNIYNALSQVYNTQIRYKKLKINTLISGNIWISKGNFITQGRFKNMYEFNFYLDHPNPTEVTTITECWFITRNYGENTKKKTLEAMKAFEDSIKDTTYIPPQWVARRENYTYKLLNINKTSECESNNPMDVYLQFNNKYLNPLKNSDFMLSDEENPYSNKFYIIEKNDKSKFMTNYENNVESEQQPVFNFLYYARQTDTFIIYSDIKNYGPPNGGFGPSLLFLNVKYNSSNGLTNIKIDNYFNGDTGLPDLEIKFKDNDTSIKDQLWQIVESTINTSLPLEIKTNGETEYIQFERNIQSYKNNNVTLSTNLNTYSSKDSIFSNTNKTTTITIYYIVNDPIYKDYYIFKNEFGEFLSIHNKSLNDCIYQNIGLYWNDTSNGSSLDSVYANNSKPTELANILNMSKSENTFVFKILSNKMLTFDNLWHSNFNDNNLITLKVVPSTEHGDSFEGYLTTSNNKKTSRDDISRYAIIHKFRSGLWQIIDGNKTCTFKLKLFKRFDYEVEGYLSVQNIPKDIRDASNIYLTATKNKNDASTFMFEDDGNGNKLIKLIKSEKEEDNKLYVGAHFIFDKEKLYNGSIVEGILGHVRSDKVANFKVEIPNKEILDELNKIAEEEQKKVTIALRKIKEAQQKAMLKKIKEFRAMQQTKKKIEEVANKIVEQIVRGYKPQMIQAQRRKWRRRRDLETALVRNSINNTIRRIQPNIMRNLVFSKLKRIRFI